VDVTRAGKEAEQSLISAAYLQERDVPAALPRHRHDLPRETVRASQALRILAATADVVAERGFAATTVAAIVQKAGVSTKTFYDLYRDKEEAFLGAYAAVDVVITRMTTAALAHDDPREMMRAGLRAFLETLAAEPAFTRMLVIEAVGAGPRVLERRANAFEDFVRVLRLPLTRANAEAIDDVLLLAALGGINELVLQHLLEHRAQTLPDLVPAAEALLDRVCFGQLSR
jgi:AcrR family transcriptional regulator